MVNESDILAANILIVDDRAENIRLLERMLRSAGYTRVSSTMDPTEVCELHRANRYDLILLDIQMPAMDGFKVMEGLKLLEADSYLSVLAVTAKPSLKLRALKSGAKDFVSKPLNLTEVLMRVHNLLEVRLLHEATRAYGKTLETLALRDALTGLANRRLVDERMQSALAHGRRNKSSIAVMALDLDGFKAINDTWGHGVGDQVLKEVARRLTAEVREEDTVARLGGDEFMIGLWHVTGEDDASRVAAKAIKALGQPYDIDGHAIRVTASAGIALFPEVGTDAATLMESADKALFEAKRAGKNAFRFSKRAV